MDRTHWKFGKADINFLVLGIAYRGHRRAGVLERLEQSGPLQHD
jgi:hypothetical protein